MRHIIVVYLPWLLSAISIGMNILAGNKNRIAWIIGLGSQALWLTWNIAAEAWGMLPLVFFLTFVYIRNYKKWGTEAKTKE